MVRYAADRVKNLSAAWLGVTLGCAECHDHKFDPFTAREFYRLAAFFADIQEKGVGRQETTRLPSPRQLARLDRLNGPLIRGRAALSRWEADLHRRKASEPTKHRGYLRPAAGTAGLLLLFMGAAFTCRPGGAFAATWRSAAGRSRLALLSASASLVLLLPLFHLRGGIRDATPRALIHRLEAEQKALERIEAERDALLAASPASLVSLSGPRREVRVLPRGDWTNTTGEVVSPGLPVCLSPSSDGGSSSTRLDLARWLIAAENPLVARVFVNRLWRITFGEGLVRGGDDFGARGAAPTHPELLDWLAVEFVECGWDVKAIVRLLVTSAAFRQTSQANRHSLQRDPDNRWLTRQNRFRLDAEFVRDNALAVSGLLWPRVGGPSVKPYQPDGFWAARFNEKQYKISVGEDQYRRGVYTYWCRTYAHPSLQAFDAPSATTLHRGTRPIFDAPPRPSCCSTTPPMPRRPAPWPCES